MPYHPSIPQASDNPTNSQQDLLDNFTKLNTDWAVNHIALTNGINNGQHTKVYFAAPLASDPNLSPNQSSLYTKTSASETELFFQNGNTAASVMQLTGIPFVNGTITAVTSGASTVVTSPNHGLAIGNTVTIQGVTGISSNINGGPFTLTAVTTNTFTFVLATTGVYTGGGTFTSPQSTNFGFVSPWGIIFNMGSHGSGFNQVTYAVPYTTAVMIALVTPFATNTTWSISAGVALTGMGVNFSTNSAFYYLVMGT